MLTKKHEAATKKYLRETPQEDQAFAWVTEGNIMPGIFRFMPILAWLADPPEPGITEKFIFSGALLKMSENTFVGSLDWSIPVTERTETSILDLLATFAWDQRVWPDNEGWPDGSPEEQLGLQELLLKKRLEATMTFPPGVNGNRVLSVHVLKVSSPFPLPPLIEGVARVLPTSELVERFRSLQGDIFRVSRLPVGAPMHSAERRSPSS